MTLDELIAALTMVRDNDEAGAMPATAFDPYSDEGDDHFLIDCVTIDDGMVYLSYGTRIAHNEHGEAT